MEQESSNAKNGARTMASSKEYLNYILEQLTGLDEITYKPMMGEFILYYRGKIVGGIYDDRLLVKPVKSAISYMPTAIYEQPYDGAKDMLLVDEVDSKDFLIGLFNAMYNELPAPYTKGNQRTIRTDTQHSGAAYSVCLATATPENGETQP